MGVGLIMARAFCTITGTQENADGTLSVYFTVKYSNPLGEIVDTKGLIEATEILNSRSIASKIETAVKNRIVADQPSGWGLVIGDILLTGIK